MSKIKDTFASNLSYCTKSQYRTFSAIPMKYTKEIKQSDAKYFYQTIPCLIELSTAVWARVFVILSVYLTGKK